MRENLQKSISTLLALLVLVSTVSFTVDKHFCGNMLVDLAVFSDADTCGMEMSSEMGLAEDSCCTNQKTAVEGQNELKISFQSLDLDEQVFLTSFTHTFLNLFEGNIVEVFPFKDYNPPILVSDIQILDQVFII